MVFPSQASESVFGFRSFVQSEMKAQYDGDDMRKEWITNVSTLKWNEDWMDSPYYTVFWTERLQVPYICVVYDPSRPIERLIAHISDRLNLTLYLIGKDPYRVLPNRAEVQSHWPWDLLDSIEILWTGHQILQDHRMVSQLQMDYCVGALHVVIYSQEPDWLISQVCSRRVFESKSPCEFPSMIEERLFYPAGSIRTSFSHKNPTVSGELATLPKLCSDRYQGFCLPSLVVPGVMKSGTSALAAYLFSQQQVSTVDPNGREGWVLNLGKWKEIKYFANHALPSLDQYLDRLPNREKPVGPNETQKILIDVSPTYSLPRWWVIRRCFQTLPNARIIFVLRDPVQRLISHYYHERKIKNETRDLKTVLQVMFYKYERCRQKTYNTVQLFYCGEMNEQSTATYLRLGFYEAILRMWLRYYPTNQIYVLFSAHIENNETRFETLNALFSWIGLDSVDLQNSFLRERWFINMYQRDEAAAVRLREFYKPWDESLKDLLHLSTLPWEKNHGEP